MCTLGCLSTSRKLQLLSFPRFAQVLQESHMQRVEKGSGLPLRQPGFSYALVRPLLLDWSMSDVFYKIGKDGNKNFCLRRVCRHAGVARAASALLQQWRALDPGLAVQPLKSALAKSSIAIANLQSRASSDPPQVTLKLKTHN